MHAYACLREFNSIQILQTESIKREGDIKSGKNANEFCAEGDTLNYYI